jgi:hypothetical protein
MMLTTYLQRYRQDPTRSDIPSKILLLLKESSVQEEEILGLIDFLRVPSHDIDRDAFLWAIFHHLRSFSEAYDLERLAASLGIVSERLVSLLAAPLNCFREVVFPIVEGERAYLCHALLYPLSASDAACTLCPQDSDPKRLFALATLQEIEKTGFFVIFDRGFTGQSFQLALAAALRLPQEHLPPYAFSGQVSTQGDILPVSSREAKQRACKEAGLRYIAAPLVHHLDDLTYWLGKGLLPLPLLQIVVRQPDQREATIQGALHSIEKAIQQQSPRFDLQKLCQFFGFSPHDLVFTHDGFLPNDKGYWERYLKEEIIAKLHALLHKAPEKRFALHLSASIASLALGIGAALGGKRHVVVYQYSGGFYKPVIDLTKQSLRALKKITPSREEMRLLQGQEEGVEAQQVVALYFSSHNPFGDAKELCDRFTAQDPHAQAYGLSTIRLRANQGALPEDQDWTPYIAEAYSYLNLLKETGRIRCFHLVSSLPTACAMALGMALGHFFDTHVYNWNGGVYTHVFSLHDIHPV